MGALKLATSVRDRPVAVAHTYSPHGQIHFCYLQPLWASILLHYPDSVHLHATSYFADIQAR